MKRLYSFFFLTLILLNTIGYYELLLVIEDHQRENTVQKIAEMENEISGNLVLRLPMSLPYSRNDDEYKTSRGEIVYEGEVYHFVKQMLHNDTLYIVCLKDSKASEVRNAISDYSKNFTDQGTESDSSGKNIISFAKYYLLGKLSQGSPQTGWIRILKQVHQHDLYFFSTVAKIFHPPAINLLF